MLLLMLEDGSLRVDPVLTSSHEKAKSVSCHIGEFLGYNLPIWQQFEGFVTIRITRVWKMLLIAMKNGMDIINREGKWVILTDSNFFLRVSI
jgi:hypothetical protein